MGGFPCKGCGLGFSNRYHLDYLQPGAWGLGLGLALALARRAPRAARREMPDAPREPPRTAHRGNAGLAATKLGRGCFGSGSLAVGERERERERGAGGGAVAVHWMWPTDQASFRSNKHAPSSERGSGSLKINGF
jgi:hypothetical protein